MVGGEVDNKVGKEFYLVPTFDSSETSNTSQTGKTGLMGETSKDSKTGKKEEDVSKTLKSGRIVIPVRRVKQTNQLTK